jgi:AAA domain
MKSFFHSVKKIFSSSTLSKEENRLGDILPIISSKQTELSVLNKKIEAKRREQQREIILIKNEIQIIENFQTSLNVKWKDNSVVDTILNYIKKEVNFNADASKLLSDLNLSNRNQKKTQFTEICQKLRSELLVRKSIAEEYSLLSYKKLHEILHEFEIQREFLKSQTTEERLKGVNIIACTLDCYIGRFAEEELPVSHFFLDEAGYACVIKALTMFRSGKPVTFLGDHHQLPPVCELNDDKLMVKEEYKDVFIWSQSAIFLGDIFTKSKESAFQDYFSDTPPNFGRVMTKSDLIITHRFGSGLAKVLNQFVYENGFSSSKKTESIIKFIHATNAIPPTARRANFGEAKAIQDYLINSGRLEDNDLVILTPYKNQIFEIGKLLPDFKKQHKILTVHGSQGREWKTVILSVSDTSDMWFTNSQNVKGKNLINTAVSRSIEELIIVCNHNYWIAANGQLIQGLLNVATRI